MRYAGAPSWSLSLAVGSEPDPALYVRDALRLEVSEATSPPALDPPPPDRRDLLTAEERAAAARQWPRWWRAILDLEARFYAAPGGRERTEDFLARVRAHDAERTRLVGEPPDFAALVDAPALRSAVVALHPEARAWQRRATRRDVQPSEAWHAGVREIAGSLVARGVAPQDVRATVLAVSVPGTWWAPVGPGVVVCALGCLDDEDIGAELVRAAFESGLPR
jgi:hypothetical protein